MSAIHEFYALFAVRESPRARANLGVTPRLSELSGEVQERVVEQESRPEAVGMEGARVEEVDQGSLTDFAVAAQ
jgi:hypothetical protein